MASYSGSDFYCDVAIPRREPLDVVFEDESVLAFHHTRPFWPIHLVVVPKVHVDSLLTLTQASPGTAADLLNAVQVVAAEVLRNHGAASVLTNLGEFQDSKHLHIHIRFGDPLTR